MGSQTVHSPESWRGVWDEVFAKGNVRVDVVYMHFELELATMAISLRSHGEPRKSPCLSREELAHINPGNTVINIYIVHCYDRSSTIGPAHVRHDKSVST